MILSALAAYYDRTAGRPGGPPVPGYAEMPVVAAIQIDEAGQVHGLYPLRDSVTKGKKTQLVARRLVVPERVGRPGTGVRANYLCDNVGYLLGFDAKGDPDRALRQFEATRAWHETLLAGVDHPAARGLLAFFRTWQPADAAALLANEPPDTLTGWLVFRDYASGDLLHDIPALRRVWEDQATDDQAPRGQCLVTGADDVALALTHPPIKGVDGAQSSGAALVSFNQSAFTAYGKSQNLNAPVGINAAFAYTTALNHLLRPERRVRLGDMSIALWADVETPAEAALSSLFGAAGQRDDEDVARDLQDRLLRIADGRWTEDPVFEDAETIRFYVLGLAPNAARVQMRFFFTDTLGTLLRRLHDHCRDVLLEPPTDTVKVPSFWLLARETLPKDADGKTRADDGAQKSLHKLHGDLLRAVLSGQDYPQGLLGVLLGRFRSDGALTRPRLGLLKACLSRSFRLSGQPEIAMGLDESNRAPGYVLGRLFALLERLQEASRGKAGSEQPTIRHRFMAAAAATPASVFGHLLQLSNAHDKKASRDNAGSAKFLSKKIRQVTDLISADQGFPSHLPPQQQGLFYLGYHHQRQALFTRPSDTADSPSREEEE